MCLKLTSVHPRSGTIESGSTSTQSVTKEASIEKEKNTMSAKRASEPFRAFALQPFDSFMCVSR